MYLKGSEAAMRKVYKKVVEYMNSEMEHIHIGFKDIRIRQHDFDDQIAKDRQLVYVAIIVVCIYVLIFLGSWSPIHCRIVLSLIGFLCIMLSIYGGYGICFSMGY